MFQAFFSLLAFYVSQYHTNSAFILDLASPRLQVDHLQGGDHARGDGLPQGGGRPRGGDYLRGGGHTQGGDRLRGGYRQEEDYCSEEEDHPPRCLRW